MKRFFTGDSFRSLLFTAAVFGGLGGAKSSNAPKLPKGTLNAPVSIFLAIACALLCVVYAAWLGSMRVSRNKKDALKLILFLPALLVVTLLIDQIA